jgi:hypothetical protein
MCYLFIIWFAAKANYTHTTKQKCVLLLVPLRSDGILPQSWHTFIHLFVFLTAICKLTRSEDPSHSWI